MKHPPGMIILAWALVLTGCLETPEETAEAPALTATCAECHGSAGGAAIPGWPPLSTMSKAQLVGKLQGYRDQQVPDSRMSDVSHNLTDEEIQALAEYYYSR
jgi:cytochrome c553